MGTPSLAMLGALVTAGVIGVLAPTAAQQPQDSQERRLQAAIAEKPGDLTRYFRLADYYQRLGHTRLAHRVLMEARDVDPSAREVHERLVLLYAAPFDYRFITPLAQAWFSVDGTNPVPVLLTVGDRLRRASSRRGDGTSASMDLLDDALRDVEGAVPASPTNRWLASARVRLLLAKAALSVGAEAETLLAEAHAAQRVEDHLTSQEQVMDAIPPALVPVVSAALRPVPFGPPGAVRARAVVPSPRVITKVPVPRRPVQPERRLWMPPLVEVVIGVDGKVTQAFPLDSTEGFDEMVAEALSQWVFEPTRLNGKPVMVIDEIRLAR